VLYFTNKDVSEGERGPKAPPPEISSIFYKCLK